MGVGHGIWSPTDPLRMYCAKIKKMCKEPWDSWSSYHLYYYEDLSRAVLGFVYPTVLALKRGNWVNGFFFVRYGLGGPHLRLRVRPVPGCSKIVDKTVREAAEEFFSRSPSRAFITKEALCRATEHILSRDPHETDGTIYPDNTLTASPFLPEVSRYGGSDLLPHSLDFFTVSSIAALDFLARFREEPRSRQLILALHLLLQQALGFSADPAELIALLDYGVLSWGEANPAILEKGDRVFAAQREALCQIFSQRVSELSSEVSINSPAACLCKAARLLSRIIGQDNRRRIIGTSQLHMTATRLGLSNLEELYISYLLSATAKSVLADNPGTSAQLTEVLTASWWSAEPTPPPSCLLPRAFSLLDVI